MIPYVNFSVEMHGLSLKDDSEVENLRIKLDKIIRENMPPARFDSDLEVDVIEHAGECNP